MNKYPYKNNYKCCVVPKCTSTSLKTPEKIFITVPKGVEIRKLWQKAIRRDLKKNKPWSSQSCHHCCEDHFSLEDDLENYMEFRLTGHVQRLQLKPGKMPHIFECQNRKFSKVPLDRPAAVKRARLTLVDEAIASTSAVTPDEERMDDEESIVDVTFLQEKAEKNMPACAAASCKNRSGDGIRIRAFPNDPEMKRRWSLLLERKTPNGEVWIANDNSCLCIEHFDDDQWIEDPIFKKRILKKDAMPSIFTQNPKQVKKRKVSIKTEPEEEAIFPDYPEGLNEPENEVKRSFKEPNGNRQTQKEIEFLRKALIESNRKLTESNKKVTVLETENKKLEEELKQTHVIQSIFNEDQMQFLMNKTSKVHKWSDDTIKIALSLRITCGTSGYKSLLDLGLPFPSIRTLQHRDLYI